jgi:hypothetical protein
MVRFVILLFKGASLALTTTGYHSPGARRRRVVVDLARFTFPSGSQRIEGPRLVEPQRERAGEGSAVVIAPSPRRGDGGTRTDLRLSRRFVEF